MKELIAIKDFYKNIKGVGKVKELTKNKTYLNLSNLDITIITDLGEMKSYYKKNMFTTLLKKRDRTLKELLD